jgi:ATP adenylyltransferase
MAAKKTRDTQVIFRTKYALAMLNSFPYNNGHLMVCPLRHTCEILDLSEEETSDIFQAIAKAKWLLDKTLKPEGYNIGLNISRAAGAGIAGHLHIHIVPRWRGDTNFMPVVAGTKVVSQSLQELARILRYAYKKNA